MKANLNSSPSMFTNYQSGRSYQPVKYKLHDCCVHVEVRHTQALLYYSIVITDWMLIAEIFVSFSCYNVLCFSMCTCMLL